MSPHDRLTRLLAAARQTSPEKPPETPEAPAGLATRIAARAWQDASAAEAIPWLTGLSWGTAASICVLILAGITVPQVEPEPPDFFGPLLSASRPASPILLLAHQ